MTAFNWLARDRNVAARVSAPATLGTFEMYWGGDTEVSTFAWDASVYPNLQILTIDFSLQTSLTAGNRRPRLLLQQPNGGGTFSVPSTITTGPNLLRAYHFGADMSVVTSALAGTSVRQPLPEGLVLLGAGLTGNGFLRLTVDALAANDVLSNLCVTGRLVY